MGKAQFLFRKIKSLHYRQLFATVKEVHKRTGKNSIGIFFDVVNCGFKYQAGHKDYLQAEMYRLNDEQRADVLTSGVNHVLVQKYNDPELRHVFSNKVEFNEKFSKYLNRDWIVVRSEADREAYEKFIEGKNDFIMKPVDGMGGDGVTKLPATPESFEKVLAAAPSLLEEVIVQVEEIARLNSTSVNTIRAVTFVHDDGTPELIAAYLRVGNGGIVDNFCSGGMLTPVDLETGKLMFQAADQDNVGYDKHPISGIEFVGYQIPMFDKVKAMVEEAALVLPSVRYVGWDAAITSNGPCLIEGNDYPGHVFYNFPQHHPDGMGMIHVFKEKMESWGPEEK